MGRTRLLLTCGSLATPVFVATFVVVGRRREAYSPRRDPVSALALGPSGWVQVVNFLTTGVLTCAAAAGMRRALRSSPGAAAGAGGIPMAIGAVGIGLIGAGIFATDPPDPARGRFASDPPTRLTRRGALHVASSVPVFLGLPIACALGARRFSSERNGMWSGYSAGSAMVTLAAITLAGAGFAGHDRLARRAGTLQRIAIVAGLGWMSRLSLHLMASTDDR
jgi:hypothetical protein